MVITQQEYHTTTWEMILPLDDDMIIHCAPASAGAVAYAAGYLFKTYYWSGIIKHGLTHEAALLNLVGKIPATTFNAVIAIICAPILAVSIRSAFVISAKGQTAGKLSMPPARCSAWSAR